MVPGAAPAPAASPLVLTRRLGDPATAAPFPEAGSGLLRLCLSADERTRLRGLRHSLCGRPLLLQLPRGEALRPGDRLTTASGAPEVVVQAAPEPLLLVRAPDPQLLLRAAYHLGNRHVALEVHGLELRLLEDPVLAELLQGLGLHLEHRQLPFLPEAGAYASGSGHHHHGGQGPHQHPPESEGP